MAAGRILVLRMLGLGDVACIGIPAARAIAGRHPGASIDFLTFGAGHELAELVPEVDRILSIEREQWPSDFLGAVRSFSALARDLFEQGFDVVYNLDTWFMPCFLTQVLADAGVEVRGNHLRWSAREVVARFGSGEIDQTHVSYPARFLASTFPAMDAWSTRWWDADPGAGPYPRFYLERCCGLEGPLDASLDVPADEELPRLAGGRPIVALAPSGRTKTKRYPHAAELTRALEEAGLFVWSGFDGSDPVRRTLARLRASDLLVTVASAPQWMARAVGCPVLMIPGNVPPAVLGADFTVAPHVACQFCMQPDCVEERDFACMDVAPERIVTLARTALERGARPAARAS